MNPSVPDGQRGRGEGGSGCHWNDLRGGFTPLTLNLARDTLRSAPVGNGQQAAGSRQGWTGQGGMDRRQWAVRDGEQAWMDSGQAGMDSRQDRGQEGIDSGQRRERGQAGMDKGQRTEGRQQPSGWRAGRHSGQGQASMGSGQAEMDRGQGQIVDSSRAADRDGQRAGMDSG